ncbi:ADP-ribosylation factor-like protein 2-binding protein [Carpediemonas membranifera]|uniref:ADP-ribosylation factor-like protein 2-binding protein n=1 Tax=Carpediemonas membranifera TaxID=201153 RepID=A0A8J6AZK7_9EUKA|nr:ADP-ribosylation factor-like protein 2-binding protein [Carpediemonas membranifera]|eukprot:KAG9392253.1 ADP-ribosylation factor-like protein 2-binding protein [Carpediemonas membranifera]
MSVAGIGGKIDVSFCSEENIDETISSNSEHSTFDDMLDALQDIILDEAFFMHQDELFQSYLPEFDFSSDENKFKYTDCFNSYTAEVENYIMSRLRERFPDASMQVFLQTLEKNPHALIEDVSDVLMSVSDFGEFKANLEAFATGAGVGDFDISLF